MLEHPTYATANFFERLVGALRLDLGLYALVCRDRDATGQSVLVVVLGGVFNGMGLVGRLGAFGVWAGMAAALLGWILWAAVIFLIVRPFRRRQTGSLLRALGFASAPSVVLILGMVPVVGPTVRVAVVFWLLAATALAVEAVYGMSRRRAVFVSIVGFVVYFILGIGLAYLT